MGKERSILVASLGLVLVFVALSSWLCIQTKNLEGIVSYQQNRIEDLEDRIRDLEKFKYVLELLEEYIEKAEEQSLTFTFMKTEELKIIASTWSSNLEYVDLKVKNTGTAILVISEVQVNGVPKLVSLDISLNPSEETTIRVSSSFVSGVKYEFSIITMTGNRFTYITVAPS